jgi:hypothetical protein
MGLFINKMKAIVHNLIKGLFSNPLIFQARKALLTSHGLHI